MMSKPDLSICCMFVCCLLQTDGGGGHCEQDDWSQADHEADRGAGPHLQQGDDRRAPLHQERVLFRHRHGEVIRREYWFRSGFID